MKSFYKNEYLFSEIYLQEITQVEQDPAVKATLSALKEYRNYADTSNLAAWNLSFVHEILNALRFGVKKIDGNTALLYQLGSDATITLCYSLLPSEDLDSTTMGQNWSEKIIRNLRNNQLKWGILTNGDQWRIYHTEEPTPYDNHLEIDLKEIMDAEDVQQYQIFNKFMRAENFVNNSDGNCQFDLFKKESHERTNYIEEELKNALKQKEEGGKGILSNICMGYVDYLRENEDPDFSDESLRDTIYSSAMLYMFRLLFLFYAKARGLLKESNQELFSDVLQAAQKAQERGKLGKDDYSLWNNLRELFSNIDLTYNGGLFNPTENEFVEEQRVSNTCLAPVIYYMTFYRDKAGSQKPISYRDMAVRHLGSLYEGLLEHKLFVSDEDTEVKVTKKEIKFVPASKGGKIVEGKYIPAGQVYFGNDKGMRKASGSFYTPEYIADYIVQNTVGKKLQELKDAFLVDNKETIASIETAINKSEKDAFIGFLIKNIDEFIQEKILNLSILDPAMGSAHFLMNVVNLISNFLTEFCNSFGIIAEKDTSTTSWRRRVVENCIYGVDINHLAVELARLSLWILSMAKDQPLSFLDHHLKCGNSLIGAKLSDIGHYPHSKEKLGKGSSQLGLFENDQNFKASVEEAIEKCQQIESIESTKLGDISDKKQWLDELNKVLKPFKEICDFHTSLYFRNDISEDDYNDVLTGFSNEFTWDGSSFFHWQLEFPEIFHIKNGFDCIAGNPPYIEVKKIDDDIKPYLRSFYSINNVELVRGRYDIYWAFMILSVFILAKHGLSGLLTSDSYGESDSARELRKFLLQEVRLLKITDFGRFSKHVGVNVWQTLIKKEKLDNYTIEINDLKIHPFSTWKINNNVLSSTEDIFFKVDHSTIYISELLHFTSDSIPLSDTIYLQQGMIIQSKTKKRNDYINEAKMDENDKDYIEAKDISKNKILFRNKFLQYRPKEHHRPRIREVFENDKLLIKRISTDIVGVVDTHPYYTDNTIFTGTFYHILDPIRDKYKKQLKFPKSLCDISRSYNYYALCFILNSNFMQFYNNTINGTTTLSGLNKIPIPKANRKHFLILEEISKLKHIASLNDPGFNDLLISMDSLGEVVMLDSYKPLNENAEYIEGIYKILEEHKLPEKHNLNFQDLNRLTGNKKDIYNRHFESLNTFRNNCLLNLKKNRLNDDIWEILL